jgi:hypothetical protein
MSKEQMIACFNEWMRRFIEEPARFTQEFEAVLAFLQEEQAGQVPSYGDECVAYLLWLAEEAVAA